MNPSPFTVRVKAGPPAMAEAGLIPLTAMVGATSNDGEENGIGIGDAGSGHSDGGRACGGDQGDRYGGSQLGGADEDGGKRSADPLDGGTLNEALTGDGQSDSRAAGNRRRRAECCDHSAVRIGENDQIDGIRGRGAGVLHGDADEAT